MLGLISQVYNEEKKIEKWLKPLLEYVDKAYIIDDGSIDKTYEVLFNIAYGHENVWIYTEAHLGYDRYHMKLRELAETDWVIRLDVDEEIDTIDLAKIMMTHIPWCDEHGYDSIKVTMKDYIDGRFIRDQEKIRIFKNADYIIHPGKIHTEEIGFKNTLFVPEITINHRRTKEEVLKGTEEMLRELKLNLDAYELIWHRTREAGLGKELDEIIKKLDIHVKV